ncbi:hypothetical protein ILYODFUR_004962 [Ilyodon furcidens]|uniref:Uncharacterized protein n=1 Tax=Ilyodon furcidens TaxID=33524 RepID=A0ABV0URZ8_9TELE
MLTVIRCVPKCNHRSLSVDFFFTLSPAISMHHQGRGQLTAPSSCESSAESFEVSCEHGGGCQQLQRKCGHLKEEDKECISSSFCSSSSPSVMGSPLGNRIPKTQEFLPLQAGTTPLSLCLHVVKST